jgi:hypothetical protein
MPDYHRGNAFIHEIENRATTRQIGYGCLVIAVITIAVLYCVGSISFIVRPSLLERPATPTVVPRTVLAAPPTQALPTLIDLPRGTLQATPTQAPIPTREPATLTPTIDPANPAPVITTTITSTLRVTITPTRRVTPTTPRP